MSNDANLSALRYCLTYSAAHSLPKLNRDKGACIGSVWFTSLLISIAGILYIITGNFQQFYEHDVITKTKIQNTAQREVVFPAVTLGPSVGAESRMEKYLFRCFYKDYAASDSESNCFAGDFEAVRVYGEGNGQVRSCFRYNAGQNLTGEAVALQTTNKVGHLHGLHAYLYVPPGEVFTYFIGESSYHPTLAEAYR